MFTVIISEKGGTEKRETFEKEEISIGRVQGNDLLLPKGNVSKRHARLICKEGRIFVADLKSTNGTYVNSRRISQATLLRGGDKVYVGDFVLRVELPAGSSILPGGASGVPYAPSTFFPPGPATIQPGPATREEGSGVGYPAPPSDRATPQRPSSATESQIPATPSAGPERRGALETMVAPERFPTGEPPETAVVAPLLLPRIGPSYLPSSTSTRGFDGGGPSPPSAAPSRPRISSIPRDPFRAFPPGPRERLVLATLDAINLAELDGGAAATAQLAQRLELTLSETLRRLLSTGEIPQESDTHQLLAEARSELLDLGPVAPLLADVEISEIHVFGANRVVVRRADPVMSAAGAFSSARTFRWAIERLCVRSGLPRRAGEWTVVRHLQSIAGMVAVLSPISVQGDTLTIRKVHRIEARLEDLVRSGTVSRAMASFFQQCVTARANILVVGGPPRGATTLVAALHGACNPDERIAVVTDGTEELGMGDALTANLIATGAPPDFASAIRSGLALQTDRLVVSSLARGGIAELLLSRGDACHGIVAIVHTSSADRAVDRLAVELLSERPGLGMPGAREAIRSTFDLIIEIAQLRDGRQRVLKVHEFARGDSGGTSLQELYAFVIERTATGGSLEGTFCASGRIPRIMEELALRGTAIDSSLFKRPSR